MSEVTKKELGDVYNRYARSRDTADRPEWKIIERQYALEAFIKNNSKYHADTQALRGFSVGQLI